METKVKVAITTGVIAVVFAITSLTISPVGATSYFQPPRHDDGKGSVISKLITKTDNTNKAYVSNGASQQASSSNVLVSRNDNVSGDIGSGFASNTGSATTTVTQKNSVMAEAPIVPTLETDNDRGKKDDVKLDATIVTTVDNSNTAKVTNWATQTSNSGTATVTCNDNITGNVTTGNAVNNATFATTITSTN